MAETIKALTELIGMIDNTVIGQAIVITVAFLLVFRLAVSILFNYRTAVLADLQATYEAHIQELRDLLSHKEVEADDARSLLADVRSELGSMKQKMTALVAFTKMYACVTAHCTNRTAAVYDFCEGCSDDDCEGCPFSG